MTALTYLCVQRCETTWLRGSMGPATRPTAGLHAYCLSGAAHVHAVLADNVVAPARPL